MNSISRDSLPLDSSVEAALLQALEQERRRLAETLLGETAQVLAAVLVGLATAGRNDDPAAIRAGLGDLREMVRADLTRVQALISALWPSVLDDFGLEPALRAVSRALHRPGGPQVQLNVAAAAPALPDVQRTLVFRTVEEAMRNAFRHAQAEHVEVSVVATPDGLCLRVQDDGVGFDARAALASARPASGLRLMQSQVRAVGGELRIDSSVGAGARVMVTIPRGGVDG